MEDAAPAEPMALDQDRRITEVVAREGSRLARFIRRRVRDPRDAEDVLQDVFAALVEANRLLVPIDHVTAWLFRVARSRITDVFRRREAGRLDDLTGGGTGDEPRLAWAELLPSSDGGPEAILARRAMLDEILAALDTLPPDQRAVFVAHEIEGRSFKELAAETGVAVNTLLSRKHYAVRRLREQLRRAHDELDR